MSAHTTDRTFTLCAHFLADEGRGWITFEAPAKRDRAVYVAHPWIKPRMVEGGLFRSVKGAREAIDKARRTMAFMDATGLKASTAWRSLFGYDANGMRIGCHRSGFDHTETWQIDRRYVVTTEPYENHVETALASCQLMGWDAVIVPDWGMWNPGYTTLILASPKRNGLDLSSVLDSLSQSRPIPLSERETCGEITWYNKRRLKRDAATTEQEHAA